MGSPAMSVLPPAEALCRRGRHGPSSASLASTPCSFDRRTKALRNLQSLYCHGEPVRWRRGPRPTHTRPDWADRINGVSAADSPFTITIHTLQPPSTILGIGFTRAIYSAYLIACILCALLALHFCSTVPQGAFSLLGPASHTVRC
jgi:hypothetical protein